MTQLHDRAKVTELAVFVLTETKVADTRLFSSNVQIAMTDEQPHSVYLLNHKQKFPYHSCDRERQTFLGMFVA